MEFFGAVFNSFYFLIIATKNSVLDVAGVLDPNAVVALWFLYEKIFLVVALWFLRNIDLKNRSDNNKHEYNKQRSYCISLLRKTKTNYYANLNEKDFTDNKQFWRTVKPLLSEKLNRPKK